MLGKIDHVGYLVADLEAATAEFQAMFGLARARPIERPQFALRGVYLGEGEGNVELFTFTEDELLEKRLGTHSVVLDHVAYEVADLDASAAILRRSGARFAGPDLRFELHEPVDLGGVRHLWTMPETTFGQTIQLLQR
ncbi:MAG: VOC family protein [Solirubrobacterales bacterium]|nr:VOC family protein [Solirubrobacterales bacterium]